MTATPRNVGFNLTDSTFLSNKSFSPIFFDFLYGFTDIGENFSIELYSKSDNIPTWNLTTSQGNQVFSKQLNISFESKVLFMVSKEYNKAYLVVKELNNTEKYTLMITSLDNQSIVNYSNFKFKNFYYGNQFAFLKVNEGKNLAFLAPSFASCGSGDFFTYDEFGIYHFFSSDSIAKFNRFDPRSNSLIVATFIGNLTVYNYVENTSTLYNLDLPSIDAFLSQKGIIGFEIPFIVGVFVVGSIFGLVLKRKRE